MLLFADEMTLRISETCSRPKLVLVYWLEVSGRFGGNDLYGLRNDLVDGLRTFDTD